VRKKLEIHQKKGRCQHLYHYYLHPVFGFMYARVQTWFPFAVQIGINGREWLARQMTLEGLKYRRHHNKFSFIEDFGKAQTLLDSQLKIDWPGELNAVLEDVHPAHPEILGNWSSMEYSWSVFQSEWASDYLFRRKEDLARLFPQWIRHAMLTYDSPDVMRFLGRAVPLGSKMHRNFTKGEVITDLKKREEGVRIKHWVDHNSIKMYNVEFVSEPTAVGRVELTMNEPSDFKVFREKENDPEGEKDWRPLRRSVIDIEKRAEVSQAANDRYVEALVVVEDKTPLKEWAEPLCRKVKAVGKACRSERGLNPMEESDAALLTAVVDPTFTVNGLRNRDLVAMLYATPAADEKERRRRSSRVTRLIRILRAHGILVRMEKSHRYQVCPEARTRLLALLAARNANAKSLTQNAA
jgi:hypothetical protein